MKIDWHSFFQLLTALQQNEQRLQLTLQAVGAGTWEWYPGMEKAYWSEETYRLLGYASGDIEATSTNWMKALHPDDRGRFNTALTQVFTQRGDLNIECRFLWPDGSIHWLQAMGQLRYADPGLPPRMVGILLDATARKQAETTLRESEERYRAVVENSHELIQSIRSDGRFIFVNPAWLATLGYSKADLSDLSFFDIVHPDSLIYLRELFVRIFHGEAIANIEAVLVGKEGQEIAVEGNLSPRVSRGEIIACQGIFRDITQRRQAEAHLRDYAQRMGILSQQLLDAQETEKRSLARELHDDLGQLLTALNCNLATVLKGRTRTLREARVRTCQELVGRALEYVRNLSLALRPPMLDDCGLVPALRWYLTQQIEHAPFTVDLEVQGPQTRLPNAIETACYRVIQEAITNIIRHAKAHHIKVSLQQSAQKLELGISDDGCGFDVAAAFQHCQAGASMGLANMRERIEALGGRFVITSHPGKGTTVQVELLLDFRLTSSTGFWLSLQQKKRLSC